MSGMAQGREPEVDRRPDGDDEAPSLFESPRKVLITTLVVLLMFAAIYVLLPKLIGLEDAVEKMGEGEWQWFAVAVGFIALAGVAAETGVVMLIYLDNAMTELQAERAAQGRPFTHDDLYAAIMDGAVERVRPLFEAMGKTIVHEGDAGTGQHTKMCNQIVIAGTMIGVCESLLYGTKAGLDLDTMLSSIRGGAAGCWTLENIAPRIVKGNFDPGFFVEHFIKDMGIALEEAARMQLPLPGLALVRQLYVAAAAQGNGRLGTQALYLALKQMAGMDRK